MGEIVIFLIASVYTIFLLTLGLFLGYLLGRKRLERVIERIEESMTEAPKGGPIKAKTKTDNENEKNKGFIDRFKSIVG